MDLERKLKLSVHEFRYEAKPNSNLFDLKPHDTDRLFEHHQFGMAPLYAVSLKPQAARFSSPVLVRTPTS